MMRCVRRVATICGVMLMWGSHPLQASHLVGGAATYQYLGMVGGYYQYRVNFLIYRDCTSPTPYDLYLYLGVYERTSAQSYTLKFKDSIPFIGGASSINPYNAVGCPFQPNVCLEAYVYTKDILLPPSNYGYTITYTRCCRNDPTNLLPDMGQTYLLEIPPTTITNTSPVFRSLPVPYFCVGDTMSFDWGATDADGDSLVYRLAHPYAGASRSNPRISNPPPFYAWPPPLVSYAAGYSATAPFGPAGYVHLDSLTGQLTVSIPAAGRYVLALDVWEYRNGTLLSRTRRDIQLIALNCPPNPPPQMTMLWGDTVVEEGAPVSLTHRFSDTDSMYLHNVSGDPFDAAPAATYSAPAGGINTYDVSLSWNTVCGQGRDRPYFYTVQVRDNGCPPKLTTYNGAIRVRPFQIAQSLDMPSFPCTGEELWITAVNTPPGATRQWQVSGAVSLLMNADTAIRVRFYNPTSTSQPATVRLIGSGQYGCADTLTTTVMVGPAPPPYSWHPELTVCDGESVRLGDSSIIRPGYQYQWMPATGLDNPHAPMPLLTVSLDSPTVQYLDYVLHMTTDSGCGIWDTVQVRVNPRPVIDSIAGDSLYCVGGEFIYAVDSLPGYQYRWHAQGGTIVSDSTRASVRVLWHQPTGARLEVHLINQYGCSRDVDLALQSYVPRPDTIYGRRVVCPNSWINYRVDTVPGSQYHWMVTNGVIRTSDTGYQIMVQWGNAGAGTVSVVQQTREGCWGDTITIPVVMSYTLQTPPIEGPDTLCLTDTLVPYQVPPAHGSYFTWGVKNNGGFVVWGQGTHRVQVRWVQTGVFQIYTHERAYDTVNARWCYGDTVRKNVRIYPSPGPLYLLEDSIACEGDSDRYVVFKGGHTQYVAWEVDSLLGRYAPDNDGITVWWDSVGHFTIMAWPVSSQGCVGRGDTLAVTVYPKPDPVSLDGMFDICLPDSAQPYVVQDPLPSLFYSWEVVGGRLVDSTDTAIVVDWNGYPVGELAVRAVSDKGCEGWPRRWTVRIDSPRVMLRRVTVLEANDSIIRVEWDTAGMYYHPTLAPLRRYSSGGDRALLEVPVRALAYEDAGVYTREYYYDYRIAARNICGEEIAALPHRSILLDGEKADNFNVKLLFNSYRGWSVGGYEIWLRTNERPTPQKIMETTDTVVPLDVLPYSGYEKCFRVVALEDSGMRRSFSNWWCAGFDSYLWVPTAFSPNGDGINDTFAVVGGNFRAFTMLIYNKWGERIFLTDDYRQGWDGRWKGKVVPEGVYLVLIKHQGASGGAQLHRSWLTVVR